MSRIAELNDIEKQQHYAKIKKYYESIKQIIYGLGSGTKITNADKYWKDLTNMLKKGKKSTKGITEFLIEPNKYNKKALNLYVMRYSVKQIIAWSKICKEIPPPTNKMKIMSALRREIAPQISGFRTSQDLICSLCNSWGTDHNNYHIDHVYPFNSLVMEWEHYKELNITMLEWNSQLELTTFKNQEKLMEKWKSYHLENSQLQILCCKCNLNKSNLIY